MNNSSQSISCIIIISSSSSISIIISCGSNSIRINFWTNSSLISWRQWCENAGWWQRLAGWWWWGQSILSVIAGRLIAHKTALVTLVTAHKTALVTLWQSEWRCALIDRETSCKRNSYRDNDMLGGALCLLTVRETGYKGNIRWRGQVIQVVEQDTRHSSDLRSHSKSTWCYDTERREEWDTCIKLTNSDVLVYHD